jgi:hypothetical protein
MALEASGVGELLAVDSRERLLGAVFGKADRAEAEILLAQALAP